MTVPGGVTQGPGGVPESPVVPAGRPGPMRTIPPVQLARRVVIGIGLAELRDIEERLSAVAEGVEENVALGRALEAQVTRLEQALVPALVRRAKRQRQRPG